MNRPVTFITGASRGLGLALAKQFVASGDTVFGISRTRKYWPAAKKDVASDHFKLLSGDITSEKTVKTLLAETNLSVTAISKACGFTSKSYLGKVFRRTFNTTMTRYRVTR